MALLDITGTEGADTLDGSSADEILRGLGGADVLRGNGGNDVLSGGEGDDRLEGGDGNDELHGDGGNDELLGGMGDDSLYDLEGNNTLRGGDGYDVLVAGSRGRNLLFGDAGHDQLRALRGSSVLDGGAGDDFIGIEVRQDSEDAPAVVEARGGEGNDVFAIDNGFSWAPVTVTLSGGSGVDTYYPRVGARYAKVTITDFTPGPGGDLIDFTQLARPTTGNPFASGGSARLVQRGADTVLQTLSRADDAVFEDTLVLRNLQVAALTWENFIYGFNPDGSSRGITLTGTAGADTLSGLWLDDVLQGGGGNDILRGGMGNDHLLGGDGDDDLDGERAPGQFGWDDSSSGDDRLEGGAGNDALFSRYGNDVLLGGTGDDLLIAFHAVHPRFPVTSLVVMDGGEGRDHLRIAEGPTPALSASLRGGAGSDVFELLSTTSTGTFVIEDFQAGAGGDVLDLAGSFAFTLLSPYANGWLSLEQRGPDTVVRIDADGRSGARAPIDMVTLKNVVKETLVAANVRNGWDPNGAPLVMAQETHGSAAGERLQGDARSNVLYGKGGNDILFGGPGNDLLFGDDGIDAAEYAGKMADYAWRPSAGTLLMSDLRAGSFDHQDQLIGIERLLFSDRAFALDTGLNEIAGQAYRIYRAAFDRAPDEAGLGFWMAAMDRGASLVEVARGFTASREFAALFGTAPTNAQLVAQLYKNILHRAPDKAGYDYWLDALDRKIVDLPTVLSQFSQSRENVDAVAELIANGVTYQYYGG